MDLRELLKPTKEKLALCAYIFLFFILPIVYSVYNLGLDFLTQLTAIFYIIASYLVSCLVFHLNIRDLFKVTWPKLLLACLIFLVFLNFSQNFPKCVYGTCNEPMSYIFFLLIGPMSIAISLMVYVCKLFQFYNFILLYENMVFMSSFVILPIFYGISCTLLYAAGKLGKIRKLAEPQLAFTVAAFVLLLPAMLSVKVSNCPISGDCTIATLGVVSLSVLFGATIASITGLLADHFYPKPKAKKRGRKQKGTSKSS